MPKLRSIIGSDTCISCKVKSLINYAALEVYSVPKVCDNPDDVTSNNSRTPACDLAHYRSL